MMALATFVLSFLGFAALALAMSKHYRDVFGMAPAPPRKLALRGAGWGLLGASCVPPTQGCGVSIGIVFWFGTATVSALAVALVLTYRPVLLRSMAGAQRTRRSTTRTPEARFQQRRPDSDQS